MTWVDGWGSQLRLNGSARDAVTVDPADPPHVIATAATNVGISAGRVIEDIAVTPTRPGIERLIGSRGGGHLRGTLDNVLPGERANGTPLYLLLDDVSGTSLIAGFAWSRWLPEWPPPAGELDVRPSMASVCIGFAPGSSALDIDGRPQMADHTQPVVPLVHLDDPFGWHELADLPPVSMRRARRIDIWIDGDVIYIDSGFQDSAGDPNHGRVAIHEYQLRATVDRTTMTLTSLDPEPRILPFMECPSAIVNARTLVGVRVGDLRAVVLARLSKTSGCTHLNDALRALADVPSLLAALGE